MSLDSATVRGALLLGLLTSASCGPEITVMTDQGGLVGSRPDGGATGNDLTGPCWDCITALQDGQCTAARDACKANPPCEDYLLCQKYCGWAEICDQACAAQYPEGKGAFQPLPECYVCNHCRDACDGWWVTSNYCAVPDAGH